MKSLKSLISILTISTVAACAYTSGNPEPDVHGVEISSENNGGLNLGAHTSNWGADYPNRRTFSNPADGELTTSSYNINSMTCNELNATRIAYPLVIESENDGVAAFGEYIGQSFLHVQRTMEQLRTKHPTAQLVFSLGRMQLANGQLTGGVGHSIHGKYEPLVVADSDDWNDEGKFILELKGLNGNQSVRLAETPMKDALITYDYRDPAECMDDYMDFEPFDGENLLDPLQMTFTGEGLSRGLVLDITPVAIAITADFQNEQIAYCLRIPNSLAYVPNVRDVHLNIGENWGRISPFAILKTGNQDCRSFFPSIG